MISNKRIAKAFVGLTGSLINDNVKLFIKNKDITQLVVRTDNCEIMFIRGDNSPKATKITGFAVVGDEDYDEGEYEDEDGDIYGKK